MEALRIQATCVRPFSVHLFEQFAEPCGYRALPPDLGITAAVDAWVADVLEGDHGVKNALDHFVEMLGVMAVQGDLRHRVHYVFKDGLFYLHLESCYDSFRQHRRRIDYPGVVATVRARRRAQESRRGRIAGVGSGSVAVAGSVVVASVGSPVEASTPVSPQAVSPQALCSSRGRLVCAPADTWARCHRQWPQPRGSAVSCRWRGSVSVSVVVVAAGHDTWSDLRSSHGIDSVTAPMHAASFSTAASCSV